MVAAGIHKVPVSVKPVLVGLAQCFFDGYSIKAHKHFKKPFAINIVVINWIVDGLIKAVRFGLRIVFEVIVNEFQGRGMITAVLKSQQENNYRKKKRKPR